MGPLVLPPRTIDTWKAGRGTSARPGRSPLSEHVPDAVGAGPGGQGVLKWCALSFKCLHELFGECPSHQTPHCAPSRDSSDSAVKLRQCGQPCTRQRRPHLLWNFALRDPVRKLDEGRESPSTSPPEPRLHAIPCEA